MSRRSAVAFTVTLVLSVGFHASARAQCTGGCAAGGAKPVAGPGIGWSYYGLGGGGPYITYPAGPTVGCFHKPAVAIYGPLPAVYDVHGKFMEPPKHTRIGYGWLSYRSPSPRPNPSSVSVYP